MNFWNDYEGKILDEKYPLQELLYPEGRSGFFTTSNGTGTPAVVRLTESLNDEKDTFEQWEIVQRLNHPNLLTIRNYGRTIMDDTPLVFAVLEPSDASLADILKERPMTADETRQIASSVLSGLTGLHAAGLFHGHIEPSSILAVGEVVKLRSDCVRKLPHGNDGERLKALEIQDFSVLLLEALTQQRRQQKSPLPAPFERIVRNGATGTWGAKEISEALESRTPSAPIPVPTPGESHSDGAQAVFFNEPAAAPVVNHAPDPVRAADSPAAFAEPWPRRSGPFIAAGIAVLLLIAGIFYFLHRRSVDFSTVSSAPSPAPHVQPAPASARVAADSPAPVAPTQTAPAVAAPAVAAQQPTETSPSPGKQIWRVVAYTYNSEEAAQHKVSSIAERHGDLSPEVFTPSGRAPYLVTLGGPMTRDEATAFKHKARADGFPRDTYTQNYSK